MTKIWWLIVLYDTTQLGENIRTQTDRIIKTSTYVIYCITCTLCKKTSIGETGRRLGDWFTEHLWGVKRNDKETSKLVAQQFRLPNHANQHMAICSLSLHQGRQHGKPQKFSAKIYLLNWGSLSSWRQRTLFNQLIFLVISWIREALSEI